jgi:hypothetical protein
MPIPRGRRPSTAALTRLGAVPMIEFQFLEGRILLSQPECLAAVGIGSLTLAAKDDRYFPWIRFLSRCMKFPRQFPYTMRRGH